MTDIPCRAIDHIEFHKTSRINTNKVAHRLGTLLISSSKILNKQELYLHLNVNNYNSTKIKQVFSDELQNPHCCSGVPLFTLQPNQEIEIKMKTSVQTSRQHAKWGVVSLCYFDPDHPNTLILKPRGNMEPKEIINFAIEELLHKIDKVIQAIRDKEQEED